MLSCVMGFNERDVFKLVPVCGYQRLIVATGLLHFFKSRLLERAVVLSNIGFDPKIMCY